MEKILKLYTYVDGGVGDTPFPNTEGEPIEIGAFRYDAKRMGGAPTITASVNYPSCLDDEWTDNVYAEFNGEKYYLKQTPTSSYDNQDSMYKHDIELVSERVILDNVYFYDAVASSEKQTEQIIGNPPASPEWQYFGNIDISKDYTAFTARHSNGNLIGIFDIVFDEAIRIVIGPPIDLKVESSTGDIYVCDNYGYLQELGLNLVFSYIDYGDDKPVSNSTKVVFFGNIREFASRLQASLDKCGVGYSVVVDDDVVTREEKLMSFEDQFFSNVLQEIYNTYEVPYYFDGKIIHIGYANESESLPTFAYGVDDALLSITKNNANYKIVNRATGTGSSDNIPFYYPNKFPNGEVEIETTTTGGGITSEDIKIFDREAFSREFRPNTTYTFFGNAESEHALNAYIPSENTSFPFVDDTLSISKLYTNTLAAKEVVIEYEVSFDGEGESNISLDWELSNIPQYVIYSQNEVKEGGGQQRYYSKDHLEFDVYSVECAFNGGDYKKVDYKVKIDQVNYLEYCKVNKDYADITRKGWKARQTGIVFNVEKSNGTCIVRIKGRLKTIGVFWQSLVPSIDNPSCDIAFTVDVNKLVTGGWRDADGNSYDIEKGGVELLALPKYGDTFLYNIVKYVNTSDVLMPYVYRLSDAKERFYNAVNYPFPFTDGYILKYREYVDETTQMVHNDAYKDKNGDYIRFNAPFFEGKPKEHIIKVEDIKPSIEGVVNSMGLRMDMFSEFAYDLDDNDELVENEEGSEHEYVHSYFFAKLRKLDFNLFDHAIEQQPMTISFTSGDCGACNFEIGVTEEFPQKNPVQVNADGTLKRDEKGRVICGQFEDITEDECQPEQQDTINNEVWIALKKEEETYGILMPQGQHKPKAAKNEDGTLNNEGDTFVILGINLPESYIINAEKKLEAEIIKYLKENNDEKFTFSISFSRIYFEENPDILSLLSENSKIEITYNNKPYDLYVSSFSYNMSEGDALPEIRVELDDTLKVSQNALQNAISQVKSELGRAIGNIDIIGATTPYFIRKDADDEARGKINFTKGIKFGEGGKVEVMDNNSAKLTIEYLEVTKKASFTSLEIKEKTHVGGQIVISPAAMTCGEVEELEDVYRCYFQTKGANGGEEIFNQFAINDLAVSQTFNAWESRYYWRKVVGVGEDYIDLSKTICDANSDIPMAGDKIVQLGNTEDVARQAAQVLSAYGEDTPSFIMYNGINDFTLEGKNITGIIWNPETQEPQMYSYGSFFFGDGATDEDGNLVGNNYITYQKRKGEDNKSLAINADITIGPNSSGLTNLSEWGAKQEQINAAKQGIDDLQYLKETFQKSVDVDGVVMSEMVAVKNGTNVVAFINGSENIADPQHGTLMFAAGIQDIDDPSTATTRIYEDGHVDTNDIAATGGIFENVVVKGSTRSPFSDGAPFTEQDKDNYVNISTSEVFTKLSNNISESGRRLTFVGCFGIMCEGGYIYDHGTTYDNEYMHIGNLWNETNPLQYEILTLIAVKTSSTTVAWVVENREPWGESNYSAVMPSGLFAGLRPNIRTIIASSPDSDKHVTQYDHTLLLDSTSSEHITLPSNPQVGQEYEFIMNNTPTTSIYHLISSNSNCLIHIPEDDVWSREDYNIQGYGIIKMYCALDAQGTKRWWLYRLR